MRRYCYHYRQSSTGKILTAFLDAESYTAARSKLIESFGEAGRGMLLEEIEAAKKPSPSRASYARSRKYDFDSFSEVVLQSGAAIFSFPAAFCIFLALCEFLLGVIALLTGTAFGDSPGPWMQSALAWFLVAQPFLIPGATLYFLRGKLDVHYYLDHTKKQLVLRRCFFSLEKSTVLTTFDQFHSLAMGGKLVSEGGGKGRAAKEYWLAAVFLILKHGKKVRLTDFTDDSSIEVMARGLSDALKLQLKVPKDDTRILRVKKKDGQIKIDFRTDRGRAAMANSLWSFIGCSSFLAVMYPVVMAKLWLVSYLFSNS
jgi:hypothetical protein